MTEKRKGKISKRKAAKMQSLINKAADHQEKYYRAASELNEITEDIFGHAASDIDCDWIIDALFGGAGAGSRMSIENYVDWMNRDGNTEIVLI